MYLSGDGWEVKRKAYKEKQAAKKQNSEEESSSTPSPFPTLNLCAFIGIGSSDQEMIRLSLEDKVVKYLTQGHLHNPKVPPLSQILCVQL